jgi:hypothetical protein
MITAADIATALNLTGVVLLEEPLPDGKTRATITADQPVTPEMQACVQAWHDAGAVTTALRQTGATVIRRLTDAELVALDASRHPAAIRAKMLAQSEGLISQADPDFAGLTAALDALGIIRADRWPTLLAP